VADRGDERGRLTAEEREMEPSVVRDHPDTGPLIIDRGDREPVVIDRTPSPIPTEQRQAAFYAMRPGGWRDYWTLLHPPYTGWHLAYVAIGAAVAPGFSSAHLAWSLLAFFLGVGISAHALDELAGRPLGTKIPERVLQGLALGGLVGAMVLGVLGAIAVSAWFGVFIGTGMFLLIAYNAELFGGWFHTDFWFAVAWGGFPAVTGYFAMGGSLRWPAGLVAGGCVLLSAAQRRLSTPVRYLRRRVAYVDGVMVLKDGTELPIDESALRIAPEAALRAMSFGVMLLAAGLVAARLA